MKQINIFIVAFIATIQLSFADFTPHSAPLVYKIPAPPNVYMIFDNSGSMRYNLASGKLRIDELRRVLHSVIDRYGSQAYLGLGNIGNSKGGSGFDVRYPASNLTVAESLLPDFPELIKMRSKDKKYPNWIFYSHLVPITDLTVESNKNKFESLLDKYTDKGFSSNSNRGFVDGGTPLANALYNATLYYRNYPLYLGQNYETNETVFQSSNFEIKYRCQNNYIILLSDGEANMRALHSYTADQSLASFEGNSPFPITASSYEDIDFLNNPGDLLLPGVPGLDGINESFDEMLPSYTISELYQGDDYTELELALDGFIKMKQDALDKKDPSKKYNLQSETVTNKTLALQHIAKFMHKKIDLKKYIDTTKRPADDAGKPWNDEYSNPTMPITLSAIAFAELDATLGLQLATRYSGGITETALDEGALNNAFDKIFDNIITLITGGDLLKDQFIEDGNAILYRSFYNFTAGTGEIVANRYNYHATDSKVTSYDIPVWSTTDVMKNPNNRGELISITDGLKSLSDDQRFWLINKHSPKKDNTLPERYMPLADIIDSNMAYHARDRLNINLNSLGASVKKHFEGFINDKNTMMATNLIVVGSNDGLINFIVANKGRKHFTAGARHVGYFPSFFTDEIDNIIELNTSSSNSNYKFRVNGLTNLFDAYIVPSDGSEGSFKTIGMTAMGAGAQAVVGYELFTLSDSGAASSKIRPRFEITSNSSGFSDLGYTYSDFSFFNQKNLNTGESRAVAVFGNGFGKNASTIYIIDANTGNKIKDISLGNTQGLGTPSLIIKQDKSTGYQYMDKLYVGDLEGNLHRVDFSTASSEELFNLIPVKQSDGGYSKIIFKAKHPIIVRPAYAKHGSQEWVFFGTGIAAQKEDINEDALKAEHYFYGIIDKDTLTTDVDVTQYVSGTKEDTKMPLKYEVYSTRLVGENTVLENGWKFKVAYKNKNGHGERVIKSPVTIANQQITFSTWGYKKGSEDDPCNPNSSMGKALVVDMWTGNAYSTNGFAGYGADDEAYGTIVASNGNQYGLYSGGGSGLYNKLSDATRDNLSGADSSYPSNTRGAGGFIDKDGAQQATGNGNISGLGGDEKQLGGLAVDLENDDDYGRLYFRRLI